MAISPIQSVISIERSNVVIPVPAVQEVIGRRCVKNIIVKDEVVTQTTPKIVSSTPTIKEVLSPLALQLIIAIASMNVIYPFSTEQPIVALLALQFVIAVLAEQDVGAEPTEQAVIVLLAL